MNKLISFIIITLTFCGCRSGCEKSNIFDFVDKINSSHNTVLGNGFYIPLGIDEMASDVQLFEEFKKVHKNKSKWIRSVILESDDVIVKPWFRQQCRVLYVKTEDAKYFIFFSYDKTQKNWWNKEFIEDQSK